MIDIMSHNANDSLFSSYMHSTASPTSHAQSISSPDFNSLLESFTNSQQASDDNSGLLHPNHSMEYPAQNTFNSFLPSTDYGTNKSSSAVDASFFGSGNQLGDAFFVHNGLRIHPDHLKGQTVPPPSSYLTEQPTANTVSRLEEAAALQHPNMTAHQSYTGGIGRQSRSSTLSDGVHMAGLSLDSPRHSLSTSSASSSQNSPVTPMSANGFDPSASFALQQQRSMSNMSQAYAPATGYAAHGYSDPSLATSLPPSFLYSNHPAREGHQYQQYSSATNSLSRSVASQPLQQSPSRMSSVGLMDQVVSARRPLASPLAGEAETFLSSVSASKKGGKKPGRSRSGTSASPPLTPGKSALRSSRRPGAQAAEAKNDGTPTRDEPTPSRAGPHRTPAKASASGTPTRPDLRRTASHTPHGSRTGSPASSTLISPAQVDAIRAPLLASMSHSAHLARITGGGIELDFAGSNSMARSTSTPGWAASSMNTRPGSSTGSLSSSTSGGTHSRRSSQASALLMSPLGADDGPLSAPAAVPATSQMPVSHAQAFQAIAQLRLYLAQQAVALQSVPPQSAATVIGTYEQGQAVEDLFRRIHRKMSSNGAM